MREMRADQDGRRFKVYKEWMEKEGIPVYEAFAGVEDVTEVPRRSWARTGGLGTFIELEGLKEAGVLVYIAEIPAGGALEPEKHLYDEFIYVLRGRGLAEVWQEEDAKHSFEWGEGSIFAMPLNVSHRLVNGGREPVIFLARITAPIAMEAFRNTEFIFNCDYKFTDRYSGKADFYLVGEKRYKDERNNYWETNFVPDARTAFAGDGQSPWKVEGGSLTYFPTSSMVGVHTSEWPPGIYHKAHFHGAGAMIMGLRSEGYVLIWHRYYGIHPYQDGHGDQVLKVPWKLGTVYSPPNDWFHQHFNTGKEPARHLAHTYRQLPLWQLVYEGEGSGRGDVRQGGHLIEYED
ncbi:MAG: cupin domain-containing protein, partial [Dehalococcoidales bacterium]|nr:cupin domain-containing protein [Dehalococcoidales bacterium]